MGFFEAAQGWQKGLTLKSAIHTYNDETRHIYTLPKEDPKNI